MQKIGQSHGVNRGVGLRFLTGQGCCVDDATSHGATHVARDTPQEIAQGYDIESILRDPVETKRVDLGKDGIMPIFAGIHGNGQAVSERAVHDEDDNFLTGSFMDGATPSADGVPMMIYKFDGFQCLYDPVGINGCGEAGAIAAATNAGQGAKRAHETRRIHMPFNPNQFRKVLQDHGTA